MKPFICFALGITLLVTAGYAARDVTCYEMVEPDTNTLYIEAGAEIIPTLGIANLGDQDEPGSGMFPVKFFAVDTYGKINGVENDTIFADTTLIDYIAQGDSLEIPITPWSPEGVCHVTEPFVFYELIGLVRLGAVGPEETDDDPSNDTVKYNFTSLLSHDMGVTDMEFDPPPNNMPDIYEPGTEVTITAVVENFGMHAEYNIPVHCRIVDTGANPDTLVYDETEMIEFLDWRGNDSDSPYACEVVFLPWVAPAREVQVCAVPTCRTELEGDLCPDDDVEVLHRNGEPCNAVEEEVRIPRNHELEVVRILSEKDNRTIHFAIPSTTWVKLDVFDVDGRWVKSLENDIYEPGSHAVVWDGRDNTGRKTSTGVYFVRIQTDEFTDACKVVVIN